MITRVLQIVNRKIDLTHPQFFKPSGYEKGAGSIQSTQKVWPGRIPRKGFIGQYLFWIKQIVSITQRTSEQGRAGSLFI